MVVQTPQEKKPMPWMVSVTIDGHQVVEPGQVMLGGGHLDGITHKAGTFVTKLGYLVVDLTRVDSSAHPDTRQNLAQVYGEAVRRPVTSPVGVPIARTGTGNQQFLGKDQAAKSTVQINLGRRFIPQGVSMRIGREDNVGFVRSSGRPSWVCTGYRW